MLPRRDAYRTTAVEQADPAMSVRGCVSSGKIVEIEADRVGDHWSSRGRKQGGIAMSWRRGPIAKADAGA
jgi:hypothetical protein